MFWRLTALLVALTWLCAPVRAADVPPTHWKLENPFCNVVAQMAPVYDGSGYGLALFAANGSRLDAHVTLISDTDAYDAAVTGERLSGPPDNLETDPMLVKVPASTGIKYFFVDSYALDRGPAVTCPSVVVAIGNGISDAPAGATPVRAQHLQSLGKLPCGHVYEPLGFGGQLESIVGDYGNRPLTVTTHVYLDSNGRALRENVVQSSGVEGVDQYALGAINVHVFKPARFLCTPVVGEGLVELKYFP